jgi:hypothetical protein
MAADPSLMPESARRLTVEEFYHQYWGKVGGVGRLRRTFSLFAEFWEMLEFQVQKKHPEIGGRELQRLVAMRMYTADAAAQRLLGRVGRQDVLAHDMRETVERITAILSELGFRFHFTGGVAAAFYGDPRFTQDVDLVIQMTVNQPETKMLISRLSSGYFISEQAILDAIAGEHLFQAVDEASMIKIDFYVGEKIPGELERTCIREVSPGLTAPLVSKEDSILSKLLWIQQGSHKSRHDVIEMLKRDEDLNRARLQERARALGLHDLLAELERDMREARDHGPQPRHT